MPVAVTAGEAVERLRQAGASGRCLSAERPEIYSRGDGAIVGSGEMSTAMIRPPTEASPDPGPFNRSGMDSLLSRRRPRP